MRGKLESQSSTRGRVHHLQLSNMMNSNAVIQKSLFLTPYQHFFMLVLHIVPCVCVCMCVCSYVHKRTQQTFFLAHKKENEILTPAYTSSVKISVCLVQLLETDRFGRQCRYQRGTECKTVIWDTRKWISRQPFPVKTKERSKTTGECGILQIFM
jgi:hypothetical protein